MPKKGAGELSRKGRVMDKGGVGYGLIMSAGLNPA